jgi:uncharacterized protein (UPF0332 family)
MTTEEAKREAARLWLEKSDQALEAARYVLPVSPAAAVSQSYYACFYAASAVLILEDRRFVKHAGVRDAVFKHLVHTGRLEKKLGDAYRDLMQYRHQADYETGGQWTQDRAQKAIESAERVTAALKGLISD